MFTNSPEDLELLEALNDQYYEESLENEQPLTDEEIEEISLSSTKSFKAVLTPSETSNLSNVAGWCNSHNEAERLRREYEAKYGKLTYDSI